MANRRLKTETDTKAMEKRVRGAFANSGLNQPRRKFDAFFEHGQWWITVLETGRQYSVHDASGPGTSRGFDFEVVTEGDDEDY